MSFDPGTERYVNLETFRKSGVGVKTPVWIAEHAGTYYVFSEGAAGKVKRIRNNSAVKLAACDYSGNLKSDWIDASARIVTDQAEIEEMYPAFTRKYGLIMVAANFFSRLSGRYKKRAIIAINVPAT